MKQGSIQLLTTWEKPYWIWRRFVSFVQFLWCDLRCGQL